MTLSLVNEMNAPFNDHDVDLLFELQLELISFVSHFVFLFSWRNGQLNLFFEVGYDIQTLQPADHIGAAIVFELESVSTIALDAWSPICILFNETEVIVVFVNHVEHLCHHLGPLLKRAL